MISQIIYERSIPGFKNAGDLGIKCRSEKREWRVGDGLNIEVVFE